MKVEVKAGDTRTRRPPWGGAGSIGFDGGGAYGGHSACSAHHLHVAWAAEAASAGSNGIMSAEAKRRNELSYCVTCQGSDG
jgi:hypothetical protein